MILLIAFGALLLINVHAGVRFYRNPNDMTLLLGLLWWLALALVGTMVFSR